jgi:hypothetical protein
MYLNSTAINKEETARQIAQRDGVQEGLICVLGRNPNLRGAQTTKLFALRMKNMAGQKH